jgi:hypothetical protein
MIAEGETIELKRPGDRHGLVIIRRHYDIFSLFILNVLEARGQVTLIELLEVAGRTLGAKFPGQRLGILLHVKHDLEARNLIKVRRLAGHVQVISLKRKV